MNNLDTTATAKPIGEIKPPTTWDTFKTETTRTLILVKYLLFYFVRVVIGKGVLKKPLVRNTLIALVILIYVVVTILASQTFSNNSNNTDYQILNYTFVLLSPNTITYSCMAVLVVKVLTGTSANIAAVLDYLPVARYEKGRAYAILEILLIILIMCLLMGVFLGAMVLNYGLATFGLFVSCVFLPCIATTAVLVIITRVFEFILSRTFLQGFTNTIIAFILAVITVLSNQYLMDFMPSVSVSNAGQEYEWSTFFYHLYDKANSILFYGFALLITILLLGLLLFLPTPLPSTRTVYINLPLGNLVTRLSFGANIAQLARHRVFMESIFLLIILGGYILWKQSSWSLLVALEPLVIIGMYHFANMNPLIQTTRPYLSDTRYYLSMYLGFLTTLIPPMIVLSIIDMIRVLVFDHQVTLSTWGLTIVGVGITMLVTLAIGILIPSHDDNPISVFLGLGTFIVFLFLFLLVTGLLGLTTWQIILAIIFCIIAIIWQSIIAINTNRHTTT